MRIGDSLLLGYTFILAMELGWKVWGKTSAWISLGVFFVCWALNLIFKKKF